MSVVYKNILFHNVEELIPCKEGMLMQRFPSAILERTGEALKNRVSRCSTGVELRFRLKGPQAQLTLFAQDAKEAQVAYIYYGAIQGGWQNSSRVITPGAPCCLHIDRPENIEALTAISRENAMPFAADIVRVVLPYGTCCFVDVEGDIKPPEREDMPRSVYLAYGSSITHGSLALGGPHTYPFRIAQNLGTDYLNLGCAGTALLEEAVAEYITSQKDWTFASVEMGINMVWGFTPEEFENRVKAFVAVLDKEERPIFATSIFGTNDSDQERIEQYRRIVRACVSKSRLIFTDGTALLDNPCLISQDMVHPTAQGQEQIARRWGGVMDAFLRERGMLRS